MAPKDFQLPITVVGPSEVAKLLRELNRLDDFFVSAAARKSGEATGTPPRITRMLDELARTNEINLLEAKSRKDLSERLKKMQTDVPSLNISFAAEPSPKAFEQILLWFRNNVHPHTLIQIGLQPSIAAGCVLRTPNKIFDFSLASKLKGQEEYLAKLIDGAVRV